jgi:quinol monooxygenase YgiN
VIIVGGSFEVEPNEREAFVASRLDTMRTSRAEEGNLEYVIAPDPIDPGRVILFERWEDQASLDAHLANARSGAGSSGPAPVAPKAVSIVVYEGSEASRMA